MWLSASLPDERAVKIPDAVARLDDLVSVVLALEPEADTIRLRALKDHDSTDLAELHVALDPRTLQLVRK